MTKLAKHMKIKNLEANGYDDLEIAVGCVIRPSIKKQTVYQLKKSNHPERSYMIL